MVRWLQRWEVGRMRRRDVPRNSTKSDRRHSLTTGYGMFLILRVRLLETACLKVEKDRGPWKTFSNSMRSPSVFVPSSISLTASLFPSQNPICCPFCAVPLGVGRHTAFQPGIPGNYETGFYYPVRTPQPIRASRGRSLGLSDPRAI